MEKLLQHQMLKTLTMNLKGVFKNKSACILWSKSFEMAVVERLVNNIAITDMLSNLSITCKNKKLNQKYLPLHALVRNI